MLLRQIGKERLFQKKEHKVDGPVAGGNLRSKGVKCREQREGAGTVQGLAGYGKNFGFSTENNGEPWKDLSSTSDMIRLVFSAIPLATESGGM